MPGFASYLMTNLKVPAVPSTTLDAKLKIGEENTVVNVEASAVQLSVDPDSNASSTVLQGKDLEALSDDPDELSSELSALAGPSAGPNGGQIYVDGFTGGQLPPKSSIREIRINQNPFSAEYDRLGYGRVEVFTKPGTDKLHGNLQMNGNPSQFNTGEPVGDRGAAAVSHALHVRKSDRTAEQDRLLQSGRQLASDPGRPAGERDDSCEPVRAGDALQPGRCHLHLQRHTSSSRTIRRPASTSTLVSILRWARRMC